MPQPQPVRSTSSRQRLYDAIEAAMKAYPDVRVGQLIDNAVTTKHPSGMRELFYLEDDALTQCVYEYIGKTLDNPS